MQYEVYVPFAVSAVRSALTEPERVARCVPGFQPDEPAGSDESRSGTLAGRLRVRIGGSSITYRGVMTLSGRADGLVAEGSGTEVRGSGTASFALTVTARPADDGIGTVLDCSGTVTGQGRLAEYDARQVTAAGRRLLDRFGAALADTLLAVEGDGDSGVADDAAEGTAGLGPEAPDLTDGAADGLDPAVTDGADVAEPPPAAGIGAPDDNEPVIPGIPAPDSAEPEADALPPDGVPADPENPSDMAAQGGVFDAEIPPPSLDPSQDGDLADPTAEAAHARRTMIGRSTEEVDHAPPRGRYAPVPVPAPRTTAATALRWALPVAAAVVASAVLVRRVVRRRH